MKICYWGSGPISTFHIPALKVANIDIVSCFSREGSNNLTKFCDRFELPKAETEADFLRECSEVDAVFVALKTEHTLTVLTKLEGIAKFVFFEKPGAFHWTDFEKLTKSSTKYFSLYNRRFYKPVQFLKDAILKSSNQLNLNFNFPDTQKGWHQFYINGCHMVDLLMYLLDDFLLDIKCALSAGPEAGFTFIAESKDGHIVTFVNPWGGAETASLIVYDGSTTYKLQPIECLKISTEMSVTEPSTELPVRSYNPKVSKEIMVDADFKPGFFEQINEAKKIVIEGKKATALGTLAQSIAVVKFINQLENQLK